ncbi:putative dynein assembly factor 3, axonemal [Trypanosoma theileri]|uniref:Putative dynein assembly factor 3, axonemal n=1 Tax=Trypanosoma theileri TaxID=67003 RepID=A0A1X0P5D9_9TRYP|nr:putative dynein assembly factor 3, axonemal [Trypanosoma theileri]ORC91640.1 putative dynein assembly factor 3, axonemal [Trypanosoma theileri]
MSDKYLRDDKQQFINGIGTELAWGWSPAIDFTEILEQRKCSAHSKEKKDTDKQSTTSADKAEKGGSNSDEGDNNNNNKDDPIDAMIAAIQRKIQVANGDTDGDNTNVVRILLCGACDIRHVFRTLASLRVKSSTSTNNTTTSSEKKSCRYHFYIYEPNLRVHCRHLFFLQWLLDSLFSLDELEERVLMFLDAFGNSMTRDTTAAHIRNVSQRLLRVLRNEEGELASLLSFTEMKSKEREFVEEQFVHWTRDVSQAKVEETRSKRLQQEMAERYDNRDNIIDWDFNFHLLDYTNLIKFPEYRTWRNTGIAFDTTLINPRRGFTYTYSIPNKTLCHFNRKGVGSFLGDIKNGPFFAFGAQTANTHIRARAVDGTCKYGNGVVSMHNVRAWLYGLLTGQLWPWGDHAFAWDDAANYNYLPPGTHRDITHQATFPDVRFHFIGLDFSRFLQRMRDKKDRTFDLAFVGTSCTQFMTPDFFDIAMAEDAVVIAETAKFVVDARDEAKKAFLQKILELANAAQWEENEGLTAILHKDQPEAPKVDVTSSQHKAHKISLDRYKMPYQLALTKRQKEKDVN